MTILEQLAGYARERTEKAKQKRPLSTLRQQAFSMPKGSFAFENAIKKPELSFICECKKASPSRGIIVSDFPYIQIAKEYENAGADCISVLTEPGWFLGKDAYLREIAEVVYIPCLRKDFTVDEYMLYEAKVLGASAVLLIWEYRKHKQREIHLLLIAYIIVGASGIIALILYWLFEISYYGSIFELGNLVFLVLVIADAVMMMADNVRYRLESQAYERLSREDGMTGLETRANFEKKLESISADMGRYRDILLMYIDIDQLRVINEEYGRAAGDEMVVISARCVENVFREKGTCYRIGGDEFAVLVYDPEVPDEFWSERLKEELRNIGRGCRHRFSLSLGCSHLRNKDGSLKSMGEWKYEADRKLYENKKKGDLKNGVY